MPRFGFGKKTAEQPAAPPQSKGSNPYAQPPPPPPPTSDKSRYVSEYGGPADDGNRAALFGNRDQSPAPTYKSSAPSYSSDGYSGGGGYGGGYGQRENDPSKEQLFGNRVHQPPSYGGYGAPPPTGGYGAPPKEGRTAEEEEEDDVDAVKQQIRFTKQESVNSTRRALAFAASAEETGRNTLARLGAQGESLSNTKKNLDLAHNQNRKAEETTRELQTLNRSMFAVHVSNPFTSTSRMQQKEDNIIENHKREMEERERIQQARYEGKKNISEGLGGKGGYGGYGASAASKAERSRYQFEADESDDEKEKEIEHNLDQLGNITGRLKTLAMATNKEVDRQNKQIDEIIGRVSYFIIIIYLYPLPSISQPPPCPPSCLC